MPKFVSTELETPAIGWSLTKFADLAGVHRTTVSRWVADGTVSVIRLGGKSYIPVEELDRIKALGKTA